MFPALIPALLMLGTFGLERVESALGFADDTDAIDELVAHTPPKVERTHIAPPALPLPSWSPASHGRFPGLAALEAEPGLPTRLRRHEAVNP